MNKIIANSKGKDKTFKEISSINGYIKLTTELESYYTPDAFFIKNDSKDLIICECSSTGDRKVHIGELMQFLTYVSKNSSSIDSVRMVLFICNASKNGPKVKNEYARLKYYYSSYPLNEFCRNKIKGIFIMDKGNYANMTLETIEKEKNIIEWFRQLPIAFGVCHRPQNCQGAMFIPRKA